MQIYFKWNDRFESATWLIYNKNHEAAKLRKFLRTLK